MNYVFRYDSMPCLSPICLLIKTHKEKYLVAPPSMNQWMMPNSNAPHAPAHSVILSAATAVINAPHATTPPATAVVRFALNSVSTATFTFAPIGAENLHLWLFSHQPPTTCSNPQDCSNRARQEHSGARHWQSDCSASIMVVGVQPMKTSLSTVTRMPWFTLDVVIRASQEGQQDPSVPLAPDGLGTATA